MMCPDVDRDGAKVVQFAQQLPAVRGCGVVGLVIAKPVEDRLVRLPWCLQVHGDGHLASSGCLLCGQREGKHGEDSGETRRAQREAPGRQRPEDTHAGAGLAAEEGVSGGEVRSDACGCAYCCAVRQVSDMPT